MADPRAGAEDAPLDPHDTCDWSFMLWLRRRNRDNVSLYANPEMIAYRAGYAAGLAHATTPAESAPFVCDVCGKAATIGFGIGVGRTFAVVRCVDHLPGWVPDA